MARVKLHKSSIKLICECSLIRDPITDASSSLDLEFEASTINLQFCAPIRLPDYTVQSALWECFQFPAITVERPQLIAVILP